MDRPAQSLERLPSLVLERICFYIDDEGGSEDQRRSLESFSLTSRRLAEAADAQRFCQIHIRFRSADTIGETVDRCLKGALNHDTRLRHVRRLRVSGGMPLNELQMLKAIEFSNDGGDNSPEALQPRLAAIERIKARHKDKDNRDISELDRTAHHKEGYDIRDAFWPHDIHPFCRPRDDHLARAIQNASVSVDAVNVKFGTDAPWEPIASLIQRLTGLRDLVWDGTSYMPRLVLAAVHETPSLRSTHRGGGCRIHMHQFALHSLTQYSSHRTQSPIDPDDYALVTSPNLYSIVATVHQRMILGRVSYTGQAILREMLGRGRSPNLRHVWYDQAGDNPYFNMQNVGETNDATDESWQGFFPGQAEEDVENAGNSERSEDKDNSERSEDTNTDKGNEVVATPVKSTRGRTPLTSLVFWKGVKPEVFNSWMFGADFSALRSLTLFWDDITIEYLADMAADGRFPALDSFTGLEGRDIWYILRSPDKYYDTNAMDRLTNEAGEVQHNLAAYLFQHLPPLRVFKYEGTLTKKTAREIYKWHGPTLQQLHLKLKPPPYNVNINSWLHRFDEASATELAAGCPHLETLGLDIERTRGDAQEVATYRALSNENLPSLETLELRLWYKMGPKAPASPLVVGSFFEEVVTVPLTPETPEERKAREQEEDREIERRRQKFEAEMAAYNEWQQLGATDQIPRGVMEKALVDCALDAKLAKSIFDVLAQTSSGPGRLQRLRLDIERDAGLMDPGMGNTMFMSFMRCLARPHVCYRRPDGFLVVKESNYVTTAQSHNLWRLLADERGAGDDSHPLKTSKEAFDVLWPNRERSDPSHWWVGWSSFPLEGVEK